MCSRCVAENGINGKLISLYKSINMPIVENWTHEQYIFYPFNNVIKFRGGGGSRGEIWGFRIPRICRKSADKGVVGQDPSDPLPVHAPG